MLCCVTNYVSKSSYNLTHPGFYFRFFVIPLPRILVPYDYE